MIILISAIFLSIYEQQKFGMISQEMHLDKVDIKIYDVETQLQ